MIKSMTGYGFCKLEDKELIQIWEVKSLNSKQLNIRFHIPHYLLKLEIDFEQQVKQIARRGKIDIYLDLKLTSSDLLPVAFDKTIANFMIEEVKKFAKIRSEDFNVDYNVFLTSSKFWIEEEIDCEKIKDRLILGLKNALEDWDKSRISEGQRLREDLLPRIKKLSSLTEQIEKRAPSVLKDKWETLQKRVNELLINIVDSVDRQRMLQELAILSDKVDVTEEVVRLKSHVAYLESLFKENKGEGRRFDFLIQECFREITTCANKAQDVEISKLAVEFKTELEKIREQVQNLE